jgi:4a-hydroxytetrahydrobiopterin dehydratase
MSLKEPLSDEALKRFLGAHSKWSIEDQMLVRTFEAANFLSAVGFVSAVAAAAEKADHHPDIDIRWRRVTLRFVTHDAGNRVTSLDTQLAAACDTLFSHMS